MGPKSRGSVQELSIWSLWCPVALWGSSREERSQVHDKETATMGKVPGPAAPSSLPQTVLAREGKDQQSPDT